MVPGYVAGLPPFGRCFSRVLWVWWAVTALLCGVLVAYGAARSPVPTAAPFPELIPVRDNPQNELTWLEQEMEKEERYFVDHEGESWRVLFDGTSLASWKLKGSVYVSDGEMVVRPWGTSAVHGFVGADASYLFRVYARRVAGPDGFVILFPCREVVLAWVVGGWRNSRSEVAGYPATGKPFRVEKNRWYQLDVRMGADRVEGWIDDIRAWELPVSEARVPSPDAGFQGGLGVATWNTLVRYRDARYRQL